MELRECERDFCFFVFCLTVSLEIDEGEAKSAVSRGGGCGFARCVLVWMRAFSDALFLCVLYRKKRERERGLSMRYT